MACFPDPIVLMRSTMLELTAVKKTQKPAAEINRYSLYAYRPVFQQGSWLLCV